MDTPLFTTRLLSWYASHARSLPWRGHPDPYTTWVSEVMLQQTRVETVIPYFERWMQRFPTIAALASASLQEVLSVWEGLGYYGRARNLHRAAREVVQEYNGALPEDIRLLRKLPGIGRYTAAAISSIAFGCDEPTLDGNIRRVLARYFNVGEDSRSTAGERRLWELAGQHLPAGQAGTYNQALMDLGSMICTPKDPQCPRCPARNLCRGYLSGKPERYPLRAVKKALPHITACSAVIEKGKRVLLRQRLPKGLLGGLWEFPNWKTEGKSRLSLRLRNHIKKEMGLSVEVGGSMGVFRQTFSHFKLTLHVYRCRAVGRAGDGSWVPIKNLPNLPMSRIHRRIANSISDRRLQIEKKTS